jgi:hypothetical protein
MAAKIEVYRGTSYPVIYNHTDSSGTAVALTGKTLYFTVKADKYDTSADDSTALIKKTVTSHTNAAGGVSGFTLADTDTYIEPGKYYFSFMVEDNTTHLTEPPSVMGVFTVLPNQTNRQVSNG